MKRLAFAATLGLVAALGSTGPAAASTDRTVVIRGTAVCDRETGDFVVTWTVTNSADTAGTVGNVRVYPPGRPLVALPDRVPPGETVAGTQRLRGNEHTGHVQLDVNWDDGPVGYGYHWPVYIKMGCTKS
jgi:hypothetical protein